MTSLIQEQYQAAAMQRREMERPTMPPKTTACKVNIDAELYAQVKDKAKDEKTTIVAIVTEGFETYLRGVKVEMPTAAATPVSVAEDAILAMLDSQEAEAEADRNAADRAMDPQRSRNARRTLTTIAKLRQAYAAAATASS